ncbi:MAG: sigma-70 family RNA polymerase sigma factor, partial [Candidatus Krumholzibacteria bacterium]|nr:sigma-70 family RNA polymerase sigma factor [Candidatus Krumholzibacteria bacterium]
MPLDNEREIVLDWKNGNEKAFEALVRNYMGEAFYVAYGFVGNAEDARDLSQDAFIKAYRARDRFDPSRPFFPWLYRILRNHCINFVRRSARGHVPLYYDDNPDRERFASDQPTPIESVEREERRRFLRAALETLSDD